MSDMSAPAPAAAPSAPAAPSSPSSTPSSSKPSSTPSSTPQRSTTAELASRLTSQQSLNSDAPSEIGFDDDRIGNLDADPSEVSQDTDTGEKPWYESYQEVHGVPVQELLQALSEGRLPEQLYEHLRMELTAGDDTWEDSIAGLKNAAMMRERFTQKTQALAQERKQFMQERDELVGYLRQWKESPEQLLYGMERMGMPVMQAAELLYERMVKAQQLNQAVPGSGDEWLHSLQQQAELADLRRQQERAQQAQQQAQQSQAQKATQARLQKASKEVFQEVGLQLEESSWTVYSQHVAAILEANDGKKLTRADLKQAARATKDQFERYAQTYSRSRTPIKPGAKLENIPLDAGAPKTVPARAPQKQERRTTEELAREMRERAGIRQR